MKKASLQAQLDRFNALLKAISLEGVDSNTPIFERALQWLREFPSDLKVSEKENLRKKICSTFNISEEDLAKRVGLPPQLSLATSKGALDPVELELELWRKIPPDSFFHDYCEYTSHSEGPLAFHLYSSMCIAGAVIGRRVWFNMGYYKVFPNLSVVFISPSGICRKTTSSDISIRLLQKLGIVKIYSEKVTPEALVVSMQEIATGLLYAPEFTVFMGRQKYVEGMVPLLTRLLDNPDYFEYETITRKKLTLKDVALSGLFATTLDWFVKDTPESMFGGGFVNRLILLVQEDTPREEAIPEPPGEAEEKRIITQLANFKQWEGEASFSPRARTVYLDWYHQQREVARAAESDALSNYSQRRPDRVIKTATLFHLGTHKNLEICLPCLERAVDLSTWTEQFLPSTVRKMFQTQEGEEQSFVLRIIEKSGGMLDHSTVIRKCQYKFNAARTRVILSSLVQGRRIKEVNEPTGHYYVLLEGGE